MNLDAEDIKAFGGELPANMDSALHALGGQLGVRPLGGSTRTHDSWTTSAPAGMGLAGWSGVILAISF